MSPPTPPKPLTQDRITELWTLFGPPPVLSTEDKEACDKIRQEYIDYYRPTNMLQLRLIKELVDNDWEMFRLVRHRSHAIERRYGKRMTDWIDRLKENNKLRKDRILEIRSGSVNTGEDEATLQTKVWNIEAKIEEISKREPDEFDHNRALEETADFVEKLDKWLNTATVRRNNVLKLLEYYGSRPADESEIPEAEYKEVVQDKVRQITAPQLASAELVAHDVTTQNHNQPVELPKE